MNKRTEKIIKFSVGALILALLFYKIGISEIIKVLLEANHAYVLLAFITFVLSVILACVNLKILINPLKNNIRWKNFIHYYLITRVSSLFLPGRLGEFSIVYFLKKENVDVGKGTAAVVTDKLITLGSSFIIGIVGISLLIGIEPVVSIFTGAIVLLITGILIMSNFGRSAIKRYVLRKYAKMFTGFSSTLLCYVRNHKLELFANFLLTIARLVIIAFAAYFMFLSLGEVIDVIWIILIGGVEVITTVIPITINGLGIKQSIGVYLYSLLGVSIEITAARYVIGLLIQYGFGLLSLGFVRGERNENIQNETTC